MGDHCGEKKQRKMQEKRKLCFTVSLALLQAVFTVQRSQVNSPSFLRMKIYCLKS